MRYSDRFWEILIRFLAPATLFLRSHSWTSRALLSSHTSTSSLKERSGWRRSSGGKKQKQHPHHEVRFFRRISPAPRHRAAHLAGLSGNLFVSLVASFCKAYCINKFTNFSPQRSVRAESSNIRALKPPPTAVPHRLHGVLFDPWPYANYNVEFTGRCRIP